MWINNAQFVRTVLVLLAAPRRRPMCCRHCGLFFCVMWLFSAPPRPAGTEPPSVFLNLFVLQMKHCLKAWYAGLHPKMPEACGGDSALRLCFLVSAVFWRVGDISGRPPFLESGVPTRLTLMRLWFSLPWKLQVCVSVESDTAEVWVCLCQPGSSLTLSLAGIHLLWSLLLRSEPGAFRAPGSLMSLMVEVLTGSHWVLMEVLVLK